MSELCPSCGTRFREGCPRCMKALDGLRDTARSVKAVPCTRCAGTGVEMDWKAFGRRVRRERKTKGLGLRELARQADVSPAYVSNVEHGRPGGGLKGDGTRRLLHVLGIEIASLVP